MLDSIGEDFVQTIEPEANEDVLQPVAKRLHVRSETQFPYVSLDEAIQIADCIHQSGNVPVFRDQLAAKFSSSSHFGIKLAAALLFGLIERQDGKYILTEGGRSITSGDPSAVANYKVRAFMNVELYAKLVEHFKNTKISGQSALENALVSFGVTPKSKTRARAAFEKSASSAGFYNGSKDRLVSPMIGSGDDAGVSQFEQSHRVDDNEKSDKDVKRKSDPSNDLLIRGMLDRLPPIGETWKAADRARWLKRLSSNLAQIYDPHDDTEIEIKV